MVEPWCHGVGVERRCIGGPDAPGGVILVADRGDLAADATGLGWHERQLWRYRPVHPAVEGQRVRHGPTQGTNQRRISGGGIGSNDVKARELGRLAWKQLANRDAADLSRS